MTRAERILFYLFFPFAFVAVLALAGCAAAPEQTGGIVSLNPCADAMLVQLLPPSRIAAISHYSHDPGSSSMPIEVARRFATTAGTAEEVLALGPSLVVTSSFTPPSTRQAFIRAGLNVLYFDSPTTVAASRAQLLALADAVGERPAGEAMAGRFSFNQARRK